MRTFILLAATLGIGLTLAAPAADAQVRVFVGPRYHHHYWHHWHHHHSCHHGYLQPKHRTPARSGALGSRRRQRPFRLPIEG